MQYFIRQTSLNIYNFQHLIQIIQTYYMLPDFFQLNILSCTANDKRSWFAVVVSSYTEIRMFNLHESQSIKILRRKINVHIFGRDALKVNLIKILIKIVAIRFNQNVIKFITLPFLQYYLLRFTRLSFTKVLIITHHSTFHQLTVI